MEEEAEGRNKGGNKAEEEMREENFFNDIVHKQNFGVSNIKIIPL